jgi:hypothetical protein
MAISTDLTAVAFDIETCPFPEGQLAAPQRERLEKEMARHRRRGSDGLSDQALRRKAQSLSPFLGYICCISAVCWQPPAPPREATSWTAASPKEEMEMLDRFWRAVEEFPRETTWCTFFGKGFDSPFVDARTLRHGLQPTRRDLLDTYPFSMTPHADLSKLWTSLRYGLEDLCLLLDVPSPKGGEGLSCGDGAPVVGGGSGVAAAMEAGRMDAVARYCERDALATMRCLQSVPRSRWRR